MKEIERLIEAIENADTVPDYIFESPEREELENAITVAKEWTRGKKPVDGGEHSDKCGKCGALLIYPNQAFCQDCGIKILWD